MTTRKPTGRRRGAPSTYTPAKGRAICARLADGESLRSICADKDAPDRATVAKWCASYPDFAASYHFAREVGLDQLAELALAEAIKADPEHVQSARLAWDARRWHLSKMLPRKFGERIAQEHSGPDGTPLQVQPVAPLMVPREVAVAVRKLIAGAEAAAGLPPGNGTDRERLKVVLATGKPPSPDLYEILWNAKNG
jgi:hypothetical protein